MTRENRLRIVLYLDVRVEWDVGVAFAVRDALDHVHTTEDRVAHLRLAGGVTTHPARRQMLADTLGYGPLDRLLQERARRTGTGETR